MNQPDVVIKVTSRVAKCIKCPPYVDYLILYCDLLDEYGTTEEIDHIEGLIHSGQYNEASEALADVDEIISRRVWNRGGKDA